MIRRLALALLPVAGFALGVAITLLAHPAPAGDLLLAGAPVLAAAALACLALAGGAAALAGADAAGRRPAARRGTAVPRSTRPAAPADDPPTVNGYWRAHDDPDWPEGAVARERIHEEEPLACAR